MSSYSCERGRRLLPGRRGGATALAWAVPHTFPHVFLHARQPPPPAPTVYALVSQTRCNFELVAAGGCNLGDRPLSAACILRVQLLYGAHSWPGVNPLLAPALLLLVPCGMAWCRGIPLCLLVLVVLYTHASLTARSCSNPTVYQLRGDGGRRTE